jgi:hypothetical protein
MGITAMAAATTPNSAGDTSRVRTTRVTKPLSRAIHFCADSHSTLEATPAPSDVSCGWLSLMISTFQA